MSIHEMFTVLNESDSFNESLESAEWPKVSGWERDIARDNTVLYMHREGRYFTVSVIFQYDQIYDTYHPSLHIDYPDSDSRDGESESRWVYGDLNYGSEDMGLVEQALRAGLKNIKNMANIINSARKRLKDDRLIAEILFNGGKPSGKVESVIDVTSSAMEREKKALESTMQNILHKGGLR